MGERVMRARSTRRVRLGLAAAFASIITLAAFALPTPAGASNSAPSINSITWAETAAQPPNCIFPIGPLTCYTASNNSQFQDLMYRPLYWYGTNGGLGINASMSLATPPVWNRSGTELTIHLKHYKWSNGTFVTARDVLFFFNLLRANKLEWEPYSPGTFPDNVASVTAVNTTTVSMKLTGAFNEHWFTYNELSQITPWPLAWDITRFPAGVTATSGHLPPIPSGTLPDTTPSGAKAVASFLASQAKNTADYGRSPIWSIVDGPWRLTSLSTNGEAKFVRNAMYSGPSRNHAKTFVEMPFTSTAAEFNQLLASRGSTSLNGNQTGQLSVGYIPPTDLTSRSRVEANGYRVQTDYNVEFNFIVVNMQNPKVGSILKQLYVRQALQHLIDQPAWVKAFYSGTAQPTYSPIPAKPSVPYASPIKNPYPFSISKAKSLLKSHGWRVEPNGVTTCIKPAKCGPGIVKGAKLQFNLLYTSGNTALHNVMTAFASNASEVGIKINLSSGPFTEVTGDVVPICVPGKSTTKCGWQMLSWGGWVYTGAYETGVDLFETRGNANYGGWNNAETNKLVEATVKGNSAGKSAMNAYQANIAKQLPGILLLPTPGTVVAVASGLKNFQYNPITRLAPEMW